jgi:maleylpyruvate isomerase
VAVTPPADVPAADLVRHARDDAAAALDALLAVVRDHPDATWREASTLPGWTRGHVLAHVEGVGNALARQAEYAARGEKVAPYDGGQTGRDAAIEAGSTRTTAEHVAALEALRERHTTAWPDAGDALWSAPIAFRDGVVADALLAWWREIRIHAVDATAGLRAEVGYDTWGGRLLGHLGEFLAVRLPDDAADVELVGAPTDVAAWLAGREPAGEVTARRGDDVMPLPALGPWPSATAPKA